MVGVLKTLAAAIFGLALFAFMVNLLGATWPAWLLVLVGFIGGNMIVALCTLAFVKEWWVESETSVA
jgi:hypothetical protein